MLKFFTIISVFVILGVGCSSSSSTANYQSERNVEPENPYSSGSGHSAGYEWAERTGGDCNGNSSSFNEGCEEYYSQNQ